MKKSKQENASKLEDGLDIISSLPDPILHLILSGILTTEEIVRTSILSTRWRYLWTSLPSIGIDFSRGSEFNGNKFKNFVDHVLASSSLDLDTCRLSCSGHYSTLSRWILAVVKRNIKQLHLSFCTGYVHKIVELPDCPQNCGSLEVLRLSSYKSSISLPEFTGFPALRVIELNKVDLSYKSNSVKSFLENCPLLEDLSLIECVINAYYKIFCISCLNLKNLIIDNRNIFDLEELAYADTLYGCIKIDCPKLVYFEFGVVAAQKYIFKSLDSLKKAVIHPEECFCGYEFMGYRLWFATNRIYCLESLSTSIDILCFDLCPSDVATCLPNLKSLKLTTGIDTPRGNKTLRGSKNPIISELIRILTCHPHLESLHLIIEERYFVWEDWKLDVAQTRSILTCHLKKVEFLNFDKQKLLLNVARSLLEHANELEEMVFRWDCDEAKFHERLTETMKEVSNFQKASSTVKLLFLNEISRYQLSDRIKRRMKKSKQANASEVEDGVDMISSLPDPILHLIFSHIPTTEEVIRTSILSRRWRYLWTSIPSIDIDFTRGWKFKRNKFKRFVEHVLASNSLDLDSFRVSCAGHYDTSTIRKWIRSAVARNIKQIHLLYHTGDWSETIELPDYLVTCGSLEVLRLSLYNRRRLIFPKFNAVFPALRVLELNNVDFRYTDCLINKFLESCQLLEDLSLIDCVINEIKVLCISCPKLKSLRLDNRNIIDPQDLYDVYYMCGGIKIVCPKLVGFEFGAFVAKKYIFENLGSLKKAVIHPENFPGRFMDYALWFVGVSHLESLSTNIDILCNFLCPSDVSSCLPNLKTLKLTTGFSLSTPSISKLIRILACHPHLESLHLIIQESCFFWGDWNLDKAETRSILTCHLKRVEFLHFYEQKLLLDIVRSLLEHGNELEEMVFRWDCDEAKFHEMSMETMNEVSKFQKASPTTKLIFLDEISYYQLSSEL